MRSFDLASTAASEDCEGGGFRVLGLGGDARATVPAAALGASFLAQGKRVRFGVDAATSGIHDYVLTGAASPLDMTGGVPMPAFAAKTPDRRGAALARGADVALKGGAIGLVREGPQVAIRLPDAACPNPIARRDGPVADILHCGLRSRRGAASGGRVGMVLGEDATQVASPATVRTRECLAQNRVEGRSAALGAPFLVAPGDRPALRR